MCIDVPHIVNLTFQLIIYSSKLIIYKMHGFGVVSLTSSMSIICDRDIPVKLKIENILVKVET